MKTKEEIEQLAFLKYPRVINDPYNPMEDDNTYERKIWIGAYTQCQEDNADKKYTELQLRFFADELIKCIEEKNKQGYEDIKIDYESLILSLNKQEDARQELENRMNINRILKGY